MKPATIPVPSYLLNDAELQDLFNRLDGFAQSGPTEDKDQPEPCQRAVNCRTAIIDELIYRHGTTFSLDKDGKITGFTESSVN